MREILHLKWEHVDFNEGCFKLPDSKTGAKRVYFSSKVADILRGIEHVKGTSYVIAGKGDKPLWGLQTQWERIRTLVGIQDVRIHDLRHTFASIGASSGLTLPMIGALLGHSQPQTTARYAHLFGDSVKDTAMLVNQRIAEAMGHGGEQQIRFVQ